MTRSTANLFETLETRSLYSVTMADMPELPDGQFTAPAIHADYSIPVDTGTNDAIRSKRDSLIVDLPAGQPEPPFYPGNDLPSA